MFYAVSTVFFSHFTTSKCLFYITDVNECNQTYNPCKHECRNSNGSFQCVCRAGYKIEEDKVSCKGTYNFLLHCNCTYTMYDLHM